MTLKLSFRKIREIVGIRNKKHYRKRELYGKDKALDAALSQIERAFGKGSIMRLGQNPNVDIEAISTGSLGIDIALGIGGLPKGRIIEIYGPESSGKTTLALSVIAQSQKKAAPALSLMRNTLSTRPMPRKSALTLTTC